MTKHILGYLLVSQYLCHARTSRKILEGGQNKKVRGGGNAINICMCKAVSTQHLGSRSMPPEEFLNFRHFQIASGAFLGRGRSRIC